MASQIESLYGPSCRRPSRLLAKQHRFNAIVPSPSRYIGFDGTRLSQRENLSVSLLLTIEISTSNRSRIISM